jgi:hypothetical protein
LPKAIEESRDFVFPVSQTAPGGPGVSAELVSSKLSVNGGSSSPAGYTRGRGGIIRVQFPSVYNSFSSFP